MRGLVRVFVYMQESVHQRTRVYGRPYLDLIRASGERDEERRRTERTGYIQHREAAPNLQQIMQYKTKLLFPGTFS